jgi:hypothetical protein
MCSPTAGGAITYPMMLVIHTVYHQKYPCSQGNCTITNELYHNHESKELNHNQLLIPMKIDLAQ